VITFSPSQGGATLQSTVMVTIVDNWPLGCAFLEWCLDEGIYSTLSPRINVPFGTYALVYDKEHEPAITKWFVEHANA
jgi:hypothetical protein